jgi:hypothetical protein
MLLMEVEMTKLAILAVVAATAIVAQPFAAFADEVPMFDLKQTCKTDTQAFQGTASGQASDTACVKDEQRARATLVSEWAQYAPASKRECVQLQGDGSGPQSYVELLTCLQIAKDVKGLKAPQ